MHRKGRQQLRKARRVKDSLAHLQEDIDDMFDCLEATKNDAPQHVLDDYTLIMEDTFDGPTLDPANWNTALAWGPNIVINQEEQYYVDVLGGQGVQPANVNPFVFNNDGNLEIQVTPVQGTKPVSPSGIAGGQNYWSGVLTTRETHCFKYGYTEVCMKLPCTSGSWPAAWLFQCIYYDDAFQKNQAENGNGNVGNDKFNWEIDFMESVEGNGNVPWCIKNAYHYFTGDRTATDYDQWDLDGNNFTQRGVLSGTLKSQFNVYQDCDNANQFTLPDTCDQDFCNNFHTVGVDWTPDYVHYYIDGNIVNCIKGAQDIISDQSSYLILNFAVGGGFPYGIPPSRLADPNDYPASFEIEYARIYQR